MFPLRSIRFYEHPPYLWSLQSPEIGEIRLDGQLMPELPHGGKGQRTPKRRNGSKVTRIRSTKMDERTRQDTAGLYQGIWEKLHLTGAGNRPGR